MQAYICDKCGEVSLGIVETNIIFPKELGMPNNSVHFCIDCYPEAVTSIIAEMMIHDAEKSQK